MDAKMSPSEVYDMPIPSHQQIEADTVEIIEQQQLQKWEIQEIFDEESTDLPTYDQYYVDVDGEDRPEAQPETADPFEDGEDNGFSRFL